MLRNPLSALPFCHIPDPSTFWWGWEYPPRSAGVNQGHTLAMLRGPRGARVLSTANHAPLSTDFSPQFYYLLLFIHFWFGGHITWCSRLPPVSVLRDHSFWCSVVPRAVQGIEPRSAMYKCTKQAPWPLYHLSSSPITVFAQRHLY